MHTLYQTQGGFTEPTTTNLHPSHRYFEAVDWGGMDGGIDKFVAQTDYEIIKVFPYESTGFANTVHFYDRENDVTLAMVHINQLRSYHKVDNIIKKGEIMYYEGKKLADGNHIHIEIGKGYQTRRHKFIREDTGGEDWHILDLIRADEYFCIDPSVTEQIRSTGGYNYEKLGATTPPPPTGADLSGCYMHATKMGFRVRSHAVSGDPKVLVPMGQKAEILEFIGIQSDGYQWVRVRYGNHVGYAQLDTKNCYTLTGACSTTLYLYAIKSAFRLRTSAPSGSQKELCPVGGRAQILYFGSIASDGYQWAYVRYNGTSGWSQLDTKNCYTINV